MLNPLNTRQLNKHISDFLSDHQRSNTKILRKVSRTFITETLTVSKIFKVPQIHINTKLNSTIHCANRSNLSRTLRDSSRTFIIEFVPSQFKHEVRSRRILRREEEWQKQLWISEEEEEDYRFIFGSRTYQKLQQGSFVRISKKNQVIFEKTSSFSSQKLDEAQQTEINGEVEEELRKRFEELRNETLKMWIFKDSPFISWNEAYNHHKWIKYFSLGFRFNISKKLSKSFEIKP